MKTLHEGRRVSVVLFPITNPGFGWCFTYQGRAYRYVWSLDLTFGRREMSIRWWNRKAARWVNQ